MLVLCMSTVAAAKAPTKQCESVAKCPGSQFPIGSMYFRLGYKLSTVRASIKELTQVKLLPAATRKAAQISGHDNDYALIYDGHENDAGLHDVVFFRFGKNGLAGVTWRSAYESSGWGEAATFFLKWLKENGKGGKQVKNVTKWKVGDVDVTLTEYPMVREIVVR